MIGLRVAVLDDVHDAYGQSPSVARLRANPAVETVCVLTRHVDDPRELANFDVLVATRERMPFPREVLEQLGRVRLLVQTGSKAYHVDLTAASRCGITVARAEGSSAHSTAELTVGMLLALTRRITELDAAVRAGSWPLVMGRSLTGMRLGLIGFGAVAQQLVPLARAFGMSVSAWSPSLLSGRRPAGDVAVAPLDELAGNSDVLSVHAALTPSTRGLVDARLLSLMPRGSYLLNASRGPLVDEAALLDALDTGRLAGAGLDVFTQEPLPVDHPLRHHPRTVVTPHIGWVTDEAYEHFVSRAVELIEDYVHGAALPAFDDVH
jgi:phosphoglycerate dehydrogenase-like enzyme